MCPDGGSSCSRRHQLIVILALDVRNRIRKYKFQIRISGPWNSDYPFPVLLLQQERRIRGAICFFFPSVQLTQKCLAVLHTKYNNSYFLAICHWSPHFSPEAQREGAQVMAVNPESRAPGYPVCKLSGRGYALGPGHTGWSPCRGDQGLL